MATDQVVRLLEDRVHVNVQPEVRGLSGRSQIDKLRISLLNGDLTTYGPMDADLTNEK
jgi:hypothetical protein